MNVGYRLPARYATTTEIAVGEPTATHGGWEVLRQQNPEVDEVIVRADGPFDLTRDDDRAELIRIRDALTAALGATPSTVDQPRGKPVARYLEVVEVLDEPFIMARLSPEWRERLRGLVKYTSSNHEDQWHCADCGDGDESTLVGYRFVESGPEGLEFEWCPTVGVLENGVLRWLCEECGRAPETASAGQVEQAAKHLAAGVKW